jgi:hypothetical protein
MLTPLPATPSTAQLADPKSVKMDLMGRGASSGFCPRRRRPAPVAALVLQMRPRGAYRLPRGALPASAIRPQTVAVRLRPPAKPVIRLWPPALLCSCTILADNTFLSRHVRLISRRTQPDGIASHSMFCLYKRGSRPTPGYSKVKSKERCTLRAKGLIVVSTGKFKERCTLRAKGLPSGNQPDPLRHRSSRPREST